MSSISQKMDGFLGVGPVDFSGFPPSSPLHVRRSSAQLFTALPDSAGETLASSNGIQETPVKRRPLIGHSHPNVQGLNSDKENQRVESNLQQFTRTHEESIYKSLGWDDADDLNGLV
jgi:DNA replication regulator SLD3